MKKILLLTSGEWISFVSQARGLKTALAAQNIPAEILFVRNEKPNLSAYKGYLVVPIGSWQHYDKIVAPALDSGCETLPWLVSDEYVDPEVGAKLNKLPRLLTTSEYCKNIFAKKGVDSSKIQVLYEAVDEDTWRPFDQSENEEFISYMNISDERTEQLPMAWDLQKAKQQGIPILLTIGGDAGSKGGVEIFKALASLPKDIPWIYIIKTIPVDPMQTHMRQIEPAIIEASEGIASRLRYITGEFSTKFITSLMNLCDVYIATSRTEGFGLPLVEAQLCGKMVITHRATAAPETIVEGRTGLLANCHVDPKTNVAQADVPDLAVVLQKVLSDNELRRNLSANARKTAIERFGKAAIAKQFLEIIS